MDIEHKTAGQLNLSRIFERPESPFMHQDLHCTKQQDHSLDKALDNQIRQDAEDTIRRAAAGEDVPSTSLIPSLTSTALSAP